MKDQNEGVVDALAKRGLSRREFLKFCGAMAALLALPASKVEAIAEALETSPRLPVIWLHFQECTGDSESFLRAANTSSPLLPGDPLPNISELVLDCLSVDYHETIMAAAGDQAEELLGDRVTGQYLCVVEGSIPMAEGGQFCKIGNRTALEIAREVCGGALATVALGNCATDGGLAAAYPNPTGAVGVWEAVPRLANLVELPGCPANVVNLAATIVYFLTEGELPDLVGREPKFAYGKSVHSQCPRRSASDAKHFALAWGDEGHRLGYCLRKLGCRGPETMHNCPTCKWNDGTSWSVQAGHGCVGCANPRCWDKLTPFHEKSKTA